MELKSKLKEISDIIFLYLSEISNTGLILIDKDYKILNCNEGFLRLIGLKEKPINKPLKSLLSKGYKKISFSEKIFSEKCFNSVNLLFVASNSEEILLKGHIFNCDTFFLLIFDQHLLTYYDLLEKMSKLNDQLVNITRELKKKNDQLSEALATIRKLVNIDPLTGIFNKRALNKILSREISFALRHKLPLSVVLFDLDHFKVINDKHGHEVGDRVLKKVANKVRKLIRAEDIFGRYGGEEFIILLPNTKIDDALKASERIRKEIARIKIKGIKEHITASFGITQLLYTDSKKTLINRADQALYIAKRNGRNRCEILINNITT